MAKLNKLHETPWFGEPHRLAIMIEVAGGTHLCESGAEAIAAMFGRDDGSSGLDDDDIWASGNTYLISLVEILPDKPGGYAGGLPKIVGMQYWGSDSKLKEYWSCQGKNTSYDTVTNEALDIIRPYSQVGNSFRILTVPDLRQLFDDLLSLATDIKPNVSWR